MGLRTIRIEFIRRQNEIDIKVSHKIVSYLNDNEHLEYVMKQKIKQQNQEQKYKDQLKISKTQKRI